MSLPSIKFKVFKTQKFCASQPNFKLFAKAIEKTKIKKNKNNNFMLSISSLVFSIVIKNKFVTKIIVNKIYMR